MKAALKEIKELESDLDLEAKAAGELEEQVEALEEELQVLRYHLKCRDDELAELRAQNEKMKCCENCKHSYCHGVCVSKIRCENLDKWELAE